MKKIKIFKQLISLILIVALIGSSISGCGKNPNITADENVDKVKEEVVSLISNNWEDYIGDVETFVYGLVTNELGYMYDVFPASVTLSDGLSVFGLAYTDYEECFADEEENISCFTVGFIPGVGEISIPEEDLNSGLLVENLDYNDENTQFILKYQSEEFSEHCVVYNQYVTYGVNSAGQLFYTSEEFQRGNCDETLGALYSFDDTNYVYDVDFGEYVNISGESLVSQLDYNVLEEEINKILKTQDTNFATVDVATYVYFAQDAVESYLLSMQLETFLGYDVTTLIEAAAELNPMECYRITSEGMMTIDVEHATEDEVARWLVGTASVIAVAVGMVGSIVFVECPPLSAAASAIAGTGIEVFMQVVVENQTVSDIEWSKVAVAACSGAVSGFLGPYIMATTGGASAFFIDSALDGLIGGIEQAVFAWMTGDDGIDMAKSFGYGFALGGCLSAGFKGVGAVIGKVANKVTSTIAKFAEKKLPKLTKKVSVLAEDAMTNIYKLKRVADSTIFHSKYVSKKLTIKQVALLAQNGAPELKKKAFDNLKNDGILDVNDNPINKKELEAIFDNANDGDVIAKFKIGDDNVNVKKQNGMVGIVFDNKKYLTVELPSGIRNNGDKAKDVQKYFRSENFKEAAKEMKKVWSDNPDSIPTSIKQALDARKLNIEDALPEDIVSIVRTRSNGWVMHENIDLKTITLVPRTLHDSFSGGISHMGGFALVGYVKNHMGSEFFERFVSAAATALVIAQ